ncbi:MAG: PD-(D/E)XK nuclease family protein, partial [Actinomycetia bacterium]|nr:PD-(D/E)XK nuclease family protein [Actinomycetes bacterium]
GTLKSPFFSFTDEEIFKLKKAGKKFDYLNDPGKGFERFQNAFSFLRDAHLNLHKENISIFIKKILEKLNAFEYFLVLGGGPQAIANLKKVLIYAREFERYSDATFKDFVKWLKDKEMGETEEAESIERGEKKGFVEILSVHKAKGLEFPVVIMANMFAQKKNDYTWMVDRLNNKYEFKINENCRTQKHELYKEQEKKHMEAEDRRLLYVACTRAKDLLVIPIIYKTNNKGERKFVEMYESFKGIIPLEKKEVADEQVFVCEFNDLKKTKPSYKEKKRGASKEDYEKIISAWKTEKEKILKKGRGKIRFVRPSLIVEDRALADVDYYVKGDEEGTLLGSAFHKIMSGVEFEREKEFEKQIKFWTKYYDLKKNKEELKSLVKGALSSGVIERAKAAIKFYREVSFRVRLGNGVVVDGAVDLLIDEGKLVVVDYKTDKNWRKNQNKYRSQLLLYGLALDKLGLCVGELLIYYVRPNQSGVIKWDKSARSEAESIIEM